MSIRNDKPPKQPPAEPGILPAPLHKHFGLGTDSSVRSAPAQCHLHASVTFSARVVAW